MHLLYLILNLCPSVLFYCICSSPDLIFSLCFCISCLFFSSSDLHRKQWLRWRSSHGVWSPSVRPLPPHPPAGLDQWHCAASGSPGLRHTARTLNPPTPCSNITVVSCILVSFWRCYFCKWWKMLYWCAEHLLSYVLHVTFWERSYFYCGYNFVYISTFFWSFHAEKEQKVMLDIKTNYRF